MIAGLLRDHLGARPEAPEEATAARRAKPPRAADAPAPIPPPATRTPRVPGPAARLAPLPRPAAAVAAKPAEPPPARDNPPAAAAERERGGSDRERPRREPAPRTNGRSSHAQDFDDLPRYTVSEVSAPVAIVTAAVPAPLASSASAAPVDAQSQPHASAPDQASPTRERSDDGDFAVARDGIAEIYVSIGRRDGARPSDIQTILEQSGLLAEQTDYIRVRQRNTFVGVKTEYLEKAVSALNGAAIAGKPAFAEPARQRD